MKSSYQFGLRWLLAIGFLLTLMVVAVLGAVIRPDKSEDANEQVLSIAKLPPLSKVNVLKIRKNRVQENVAWNQLLLAGGKENEYAIVPISDIEFQENRVKVKVFNTTGIEEYRFFNFQDIIYPLDDSQLLKLAKEKIVETDFVDLNGNANTLSAQEMIEKIKTENVEERVYWLGSDLYGRDMLSRIMAGSYVTLIVGFSSVLIALFIGVLVGVIAGYFGGLLERILLWLMNVFWSIPAILLVISITLALGQGVLALVLGIGFILWVEMAQVLRGEVKSIAHRDYIKAAKLMGLSDARILYKHVLPNLFGPILVLAVSNFAQAILLEAGLNFLGVGVSLPRASWGGMVRELYGFLITDGAYMALVPSLAIIFLVLSAVVIGNELKIRFNLKYGLMLKRG